MGTMIQFSYQHVACSIVYHAIGLIAPTGISITLSSYYINI